MTTANTQQISISMDGIWAGSGQLRDGIIENCCAQFCDNNDASLLVYDLIEDAIANGHDSLKVEINGESKVISWSLT